MELDVSAENEALFRQRLARAVEEYLSDSTTSPAPSFSSADVETVPLAEVIDAVGTAESIIAQYDMAACIKHGSLYGTESMKNLARWLVNGGTPEVSDLLRRLRRFPSIAIWPLAEAGVSAEYLSACIDAGILDSGIIGQGYSNGISIEFLAPAAGV